MISFFDTQDSYKFYCILSSGQTFLRSFIKIQRKLWPLWLLTCTKSMNIWPREPIFWTYMTPGNFLHSAISANTLTKFHKNPMKTVTSKALDISNDWPTNELTHWLHSDSYLPPQTLWRYFRFNSITIILQRSAITGGGRPKVRFLPDLCNWFPVLTVPKLHV